MEEKKRGNPKWIKGYTANPKGRPKNKKSLTWQLEQHVKQLTIDADGNKIEKSELMAKLVTDAILTGSVVLYNPETDSEKTLNFNAITWSKMVQWTYKQVEGNKPQDVNIESFNGGIVYLPPKDD